MIEGGLFFGFDLDGCVADTYTSLMPVLNELYGLNLRTDDINAYNLEDQTGLSRDQILEAFELMIVERYESIPPIQGAIEALSLYQSETGRSIPFITARPSRQISPTHSWLELYLCNIDYSIDFVDGSISKSAPAKKRKINIFVEDCADTANELSEAGIHVLLLERNWNKQEEVGSGVTRIKGGWMEVVSDYIGPSLHKEAEVI